MKRISRQDLKSFKRLGFIRSGGYADMSKFENPKITPLGVLEYFMNEFQTLKAEYMPIEHHSTYFKRGDSRMYFNTGYHCYVHGNILYIGLVEEKENNIVRLFGAFYKIPKD